MLKRILFVVIVILLLLPYCRVWRNRPAAR